MFKVSEYVSVFYYVQKFCPLGIWHKLDKSVELRDILKFSQDIHVLWAWSEYKVEYKRDQNIRISELFFLEARLRKCHNFFLTISLKFYDFWKYYCPLLEYQIDWFNLILFYFI